MMNNTRYRNRQLCPSCRQSYTPVKLNPVCHIKNGNDALYIFFCTCCCSQYHCLESDAQKQMRRNAIEVMIKDRTTLWACTSHFALTLNRGDLDQAIENGLCGMDRITYEALAHADDACIFINGVPVAL